MASRRIPFIAAAALFILFGLPPESPRAAATPQVPAALRDRAAQHARVRVIVELNAPATGRGAATARQITEARLLSKIPAAAHRVARRFQASPYVALEVTPEGLTALENAGRDVVRVMPDAILKPVLAQSVPLIEGDQAWDQGFDGTGTMVAVVDTGVDSTHPS